MSSVADVVAKLRERTRRRLPKDWKEGRKCPGECGAGASRPKCFLDMGGYCPRHDPDNYEPSPYVVEPDPLCAEAADLLACIESFECEQGKVAGTLETFGELRVKHGRTGHVLDDEIMRDLRRRWPAKAYQIVAIPEEIDGQA